MEGEEKERGRITRHLKARCSLSSYHPRLLSHGHHWTSHVTRICPCTGHGILGARCELSWGQVNLPGHAGLISALSTVLR